ncbi:MAG TPA: hypothetical protein VFJ07_08965 [Streptosporangiaceae bacterium]|nr:hypothetical protein [Streptosporangiaceae bacterium]
MTDDPPPMQPMRRVRYYMGRCEDALDSATTALHATPVVDADWREEFLSDLAVLRSKLDILRVLMNGR